MRTGIGKALALCALLTIGRVVPMAAQNNAGAHVHEDPAPHGGQIAEVARHHVEFKADSTGSIAVWLLDEHGKTLPPPSAVRVTLVPGAGAKTTMVTLQIDSRGQRLVGEFDRRTLRSFEAVVSILIDGTRRNLRFHYPA